MNALCTPNASAATGQPTASVPPQSTYHVERDAIYAYRSAKAPLLARCPKEADGRDGIRRSERDANLRLFAAAPRMLGTLVRLEAHLTLYVHAHAGADAVRKAALKDLRNAIRDAQQGPRPA